MKKYIFICFYILISLNIYCQNEIAFKIKYKPGIIYNQSTQSSSRSEMKYSGSPEFLKRLEEKRIENPTINFNKTFIESVVTTGKSEAGIFPISVKFLGGEKAIIPNGTMLYGKVKENQNPEFDSIYAPDREVEMRTTLFETLKNSMSQLNFPEKNVKIGETFSQEVPLKIPVGKVVINMVSKTIYKLTKIDNKKAFFDLIQSYSLSSDVESANIKAFGNGTGEIIYDIENSFYLSYELDSSLNMEVQIENININVLSQTNTKLSSTILKS